MQVVVRRLTGATGENQVAIIATTLLIAALFTPLRRAIQAGIDRAFYRGKYDAGQTLTAFAARMRVVTDLVDLQAHIVDAVQQTLHPTHITIWLRLPRPPSTGRSVDEGIPRR